jgi:hypothetical protein
MDSQKVSEGFSLGLGFIFSVIVFIYFVIGVNSFHFSEDETQKPEKMKHKNTKIILERK